MTTSAEAKTEEKRYKYYGLEYRLSVTEMAALVPVSVRTYKTFLKLKSMGYQSHINAGWTAAQCFAHAGVGPKRRLAPTRADMDNAKYEIQRLREMVVEFGGDPDNA